MKKIITLLLLFIMAACTQGPPTPPPPNNPNAKLAPVTFEEDIALNPPKEQQFDFYFGKYEKPDQRFMVGVEFWVPADQHFQYFSTYLSSPWRQGKNLPYFDVAIEQHLTDGTVKVLPLQGVKHFIFEDLAIVKYTTPPARFSVFCLNAEARQDGGGRLYDGWLCSMTGLDLDKLDNYQDGFFRLKIKLASPLKLDGFVRVTAMVLYQTNHK